MTLKPAVPFHALNEETGWEPVPGGAPGVEMKMLSGALDEEAKTGVRTRLIRFQPGAVAPAVFVHDYWEEVYLLSGVLVTGCDAEGKGGTAFEAPAYACRPPGTEHGPFTSEAGCSFFEIQYYIDGDG
ncbi:cupin domain-containing protein [Roseivivax sp. GX 12232]|uniref:cupin domain-containing protein n=1 Tax=Roseivivax sp. GX 12232 TaxID=2900547 RepID=UPI001E57B4EB|nr:cupin domain-containing protein [Roseivivax sp. GX 12232]MCE0506146.1 cupin domain-containing protein [Roseivivax sp. GX 12232]